MDANETPGMAMGSSLPGQMSIWADAAPFAGCVFFVLVLVLSIAVLVLDCVQYDCDEESHDHDRIAVFGDR